MHLEGVDILTVVSAPFEENTFVLRLGTRDDCVIVDPGLEPDEIIAAVERHGWTPAAMLITHGHADHIGGNRALKERWPKCPIVIGEHDAIKLIDAKENLSAGFGLPVTSPPADVMLAENQFYETAGFRFEVRHIPGHSTGHVVYVWHDHDPKLVLGGDILFAGSVGRTDFPGGSMKMLADGIHQKLFTLDDSTIVLPGHGPPTTIGREKRSNPFVGTKG